MKITLTFDEEEEAMVAMNGHKYLRCLEDLDGELRRRSKYTDEETIDLVLAREFIREYLQENGVSLYE